jgi:hypothetical protein
MALSGVLVPLNETVDDAVPGAATVHVRFSPPNVIRAAPRCVPALKSVGWPRFGFPGETSFRDPPAPDEIAIERSVVPLLIYVM